MTIELRPRPGDPVTSAIWLVDTDTDEMYMLDGGDGAHDEHDVPIAAGGHWLDAFVAGCVGQTRADADEWLDEHTALGHGGWERPDAEEWDDLTE